MPPAAQHRSAPLDRDLVVDAALRLVARDGFGALSMRRVAAELGVGTMSLYWHVPTREDLLDLMVERAAAEQVLDEVPADWRAALTRIARGARRAFERNPWMLEAAPRPRLGAVLLEHVEQSIAATESMGLPLPDRMVAISAVDDYVLGYVVGRHVRPSGELPALTEEAAARVAAGSYPRFAEAVAAIEATDDWMQAQEFEVGLALLLDGIAAAVASGRMPGMTSVPLP